MKLFHFVFIACLCFHKYHAQQVKGVQRLSLEQGVSTKLQAKNLFHQKGYRLNVTASETTEVESAIKCISGCVKKKDCFSLNVGTMANNRFQCEFLNTSKYVSSPGKLISVPTYVHWFLQDPCVPDPCILAWQEPCVKDKSNFRCYFNTSYNIALGKPTSQTDTFTGGFVSSFAVDGRRPRDSRASDGTPQVSSTAFRDFDPPVPLWWRVDFQREFPVSRVVIVTGAGSEAVWHLMRLVDFQIKIGNSLADEGRQNTGCGNLHTIMEDKTESFACNPPITGRYLVIHLVARRIIFSEVEVYPASVQST